MFVDRKEELALLERLVRLPEAAMLVLYGRRRVGKTELLREFTRTRRAVFFVADQRPAETLLREFSSVLWRAAGESADSAPAFPGWGEALAYAGRLAEQQGLVLVLDEFPYLAGSDPSLPSVVQAAWDAHLRTTKLLLILCGSSVAYMEGEVLSQKSPLFGRRTSQLLLQPMELPEAAAFWKGCTPEDAVRRYAVAGGIPAYAQRLRAGRSLGEAVRETILDKNGYLYEEVPYLLMQELREPRVYLALLQAMAGGRTAQNEIAQAAGMKGNAAAPYLRTLVELRLVERVVPVQERHPHKSRKGMYRIRDPYFRFWLRFVLPERSRLDQGLTDAVWKERVAPRLDEHVSLVFEDLAASHLWRLARRDALPFVPVRIGPWVAPDGEVDLVAVSGDGHQALLCECKWTREPAGERVLDTLRKRAQRVAEDMGLRSVTLALCARAGATPAVRRALQGAGGLLFEPRDLLRG